MAKSASSHTAALTGTAMASPSASKKALPCGRQAAARPALPRPERIAEWQKQLRDYLAGQGLKYSEQRWKIAEIILASGGHLDAQSLVERVKQEHPGIGAATVYRSIKVLCDAHILKESLMDTEGKVIYELFDDDHHDHIVCMDCGEIFEFHNDKIESLQNGITREMHFSQVKHRHVIYVHCNLLGDLKSASKSESFKKSK